MSIDARRLGLVVPAYRPDWGRLTSYLYELEDELSPATIRVELDDPTPEDRRRARDLPVEVNLVDHRRGKGAALTDGFDALETLRLGFVDADASTPAEAFADVVGALDRGADVAVGSRRVEGAHAERPLHREVLGRGLSWLARRMIGIQLGDYQCGAKAMTREAWQAIRSDVREEGFAWDMEALALADVNGLEIQEVPVRWTEGGNSTVDPVRALGEFQRALVSIRRRTKAER